MENRQWVVVIGIITNDKGEFYMSQRNDPGTDEHQLLEFPGGKLEFGEDPEAAVIRELKEETGYDVKIVRLLPKIFTNIFRPNPNHPDSAVQCILLTYECKIVGGEFKPQSEKVLEGKFYSKETVDFNKAFKHCQQMIELLGK